MDPTDALNACKARLDIKQADTTFDELLEQFLVDSVKRLAPSVYREVGVQQVAVTPSSRGEVTIDLSTLTTPLDDVREVEASAGDGEWPVDDRKSHGSSLRVRELDSNVTTLYLYGLKAYELTNVPVYMHLIVIYFAVAEFWSFLASNKAKYNVYMQNGRAAVDNAQDQADVWEEKAQALLEPLGVPYGS